MKQKVTTITRSSPDYPANIELFLGEESPATVSLLGETEILARDGKTALFCSSKCPGNAILKAYDLAQRLRAEGRTVISGFHSPMEKECLAILLRSPHPVIMCPARGLGTMRIRQEWKQPLADGRLLILSPFPPEMKRGTSADGTFRNRFVAALADEILIPYAVGGGKIDRLTKDIQAWGKRLSPSLAMEGRTSFSTDADPREICRGDARASEAIPKHGRATAGASTRSALRHQGRLTSPTREQLARDVPERSEDTARPVTGAAHAG